MKLIIYINWDYLGLMVAMVLYPIWSMIEYVVTIVRAIKIWSDKQINDK